MNERAGTRRERLFLSDSDSEEDRRPSSSTARRNNNRYGSQRVNRGSRPTTRDGQRNSNSRGRRGSYEEPTAFENLDEQAAPPPIENPDDRHTYGRQSFLEDADRLGRSSPRATPERRSNEPHESVRKRRSAQQGQQVLSEVAAPPAVQKSLNDDDDGIGRERFLEDEERGKDGSDEASPPFAQKRPEDYMSNGDESREVPKWLTELYTISHLIFFAILGTLARLGTQWITFYPGTPIVTPVVWANFGGSVVMGFLSEDQGLFRDRSTEHHTTNGQGVEMRRRRSRIEEDMDEMAKMSKADHSKRKKTIPLFIGLATGFCGSFTSFSSFARDFFLALSNDLPTPINHPHSGQSAPSPTTTVSRNGGYSFEAFIHVVFVTLALSLGGLIAGAQIAIFLDGRIPRIHGSFTRRFVDPLVVALGFGSWLGAVVLAIWPPDRPGGPSSRGSWSHEAWRGEVIFALVFAPLGCLLRFYASLKLNGLVPAFPLGTFAVNMLGTAVEGMCFDVQHVGVGVMGRVGGGLVGCQILQGIMDGFCGCLTTVSTWVVEISGLKRKHGWAYAFGSILGGLCLMVVIMGSVRWSAGYSEPICDTGYTSKVHG